MCQSETEPTPGLQQSKGCQPGRKYISRYKGKKKLKYLGANCKAGPTGVWGASAQWGDARRSGMHGPGAGALGTGRCRVSRVSRAEAGSARAGHSASWIGGCRKGLSLVGAMLAGDP